MLNRPDRMKRGLFIAALFAVMLLCFSNYSSAQDIYNYPATRYVKSLQRIVFPPLKSKLGYEKGTTLTTAMQVYGADVVPRDGQRTRRLYFLLVSQPEEGATTTKTITVNKPDFDMVLLRLDDAIRTFKSRSEKKSFDGKPILFSPAPEMTLGVGSTDIKDGVLWTIASDSTIFVSSSVDDLEKLRKDTALCIDWLTQNPKNQKKAKKVAS